MNWRNNNFGKLPFDKKTATAAAIFSALGGIGYVVVPWITSTDTIQKIHIKHKLLTMKFPKPSHIGKVLLYTCKCKQVYVFDNSLVHYIYRRITSHERLILNGSSTCCRND